MRLLRRSRSLASVQRLHSSRSIAQSLTRFCTACALVLAEKVLGDHQSRPDASEVPVGGLTVLLPFAWRDQRKSKRTVRDLILSMAHTYAELSGDGAVSTRRVREVAARAADLGVVWPNPLFLILDANIARVGRL